MTFSDDLASHLSEFQSAPFLFVGSGFSRRYVGAADWQGLLRRFAELTTQPYERYYSSADGYLPRVASLIADQLHDIWWESPEYAESRASNPHPQGKSSPLKIEIAHYLEDSVSQLPESGPLADELAALKKATVEGVITTNYDPVLETVFPEFAVFSGQDELLFHDPKGVGEIYKIHGSSSKPESLVLTDGDYDRFRSRNAYLAAKLLTIFVEHPVIFIGYSLNDDNVQQILTSIARVLTNENLGKLQDRLIFIQWDPAATEPKLVATPFSADGMAIPMLAATVRDFAELFDALGRLKRRFPARFLRQLKEQVYELVQTSEPKDKVYVSDIDADVDAAQVDVVIGVGVQSRLSSQGIVGIERRDLLHDVLEDRLPFDEPDTMDEIVRLALPRHLKSKANTPIYRYLRGAGRLDDSGALRNDSGLPEVVRRRISAGITPLKAPLSYQPKVMRQVAEAQDFATLVARFTPDEVIFAAPHLDPGSIDPNELRNFLVDHIDLLSGNSLQASQWAKCLCLYDYLTYVHFWSEGDG